MLGLANAFPLSVHSDVSPTSWRKRQPWLPKTVTIRSGQAIWRNRSSDVIAQNICKYLLIKGLWTIQE